MMKLELRDKIRDFFPAVTLLAILHPFRIHDDEHVYHRINNQGAEYNVFRCFLLSLQRFGNMLDT